MIIKSFIPGRIRFRAAVLKQPAQMTAFTEKLKALPGFELNETSAVTGSVVTYYNAKAVSQQEAARWLTDNLPETLLKPVCKKHPRKLKQHRHPISKTRPYYQAMSVALLLCLVSPAAGMWQVHRYSAYAFAAMAAGHMLDYRKRII